MKQLFFVFSALLFLLRAPAQTVTAAEYFFDTDPGAGQATALAVGTPGSSVTFSASIPTDALSAGFHTLCIRNRDAGGGWGHFEQRTVYVSAAVNNSAPLISAEYFIDHDPGAGNGTALGVSIPGGTVQFSAVIPVASLAPGFHTLVIRAKNAAGVWGLFETRGFYLHALPVTAQAIVAAEFFVDSDPGAGNGTPLSVGASGNTVSFVATLPTNALQSGFHTLAIRTKDAGGTWGSMEMRGFYVQPAAAVSAPITEAEFFLDADPGVGNGSPLAVPMPGTTVSQNFVIPIPSSTPNGEHLLAIRAKDAAGVWGLFELVKINVSGFTLPLNWLSFGVKRAGEKSVLDWRTGNEVNASHFEIERSANGIDFRKIGETRAKGLADNRYSHDDAQPLPGLNYYRLKQVDKDGKFTYSVIARIYFGDAVNTLRVFPQPTSGNLNVVFGGKGKEAVIQVYDAGGRLVLSERKSNVSPLVVSTQELAGGVYWLVVSDGVTLQKGQLVKSR